MVQTPRVALTQITTIPGGGWTTHLKIVSQIGSFPKRCGLNNPPPRKWVYVTCPLKRGQFQRKKILFQPSFFSGYLSFRVDNLWNKNIEVAEVPPPPAPYAWLCLPPPWHLQSSQRLVRVVRIEFTLGNGTSSTLNPISKLVGYMTEMFQQQTNCYISKLVYMMIGEFQVKFFL